MARLTNKGWFFLALLAGCSAPPPPVKTVQVDRTTESWYGPTVEEAARLSREAELLFRQGKGDAAGEKVQKGQALVSRLLAAPRPTLPAVQVAADLDDLYGRMLLHNKQYGWARSMFQKNVTRWKHWKPESPETEQRLRVAMSQVAECDRRLTE